MPCIILYCSYVNYLSAIQELDQTIAEVCKKVNRSPKEIFLIAVSKQFSAVTVNNYLTNVKGYWKEQALSKPQSHPHLGENKVQEVLAKKNALDPHTLHFIGHLQTNKVKQVLPYIDYLQSLDSIKLANTLNQALGQLTISKPEGHQLKVLIQANTSAETNKYGGDFNATRNLLAHTLTLSRISVCGLMTMAPFTENEGVIRNCFKNLRLWRDRLQNEFAIELPELSMGMSHDFRIAIEEGATMVRIGSAIFGARIY